MMNPKNLVLTLALVGCAFPLHAADTVGGDVASPLSYDYVDLGLAKINISGVESDADGYNIGLSKSLGDSFFLSLSAAALEVQDYYLNADTQSYALSFGYHHSLSSNVDLVLGGGPVHLRVQRGGGKGSATGGQASLGLRASPAPKLELSAGIEHQRVKGTSATGYAVGARYLFTPHFSLGMNLGSGDGFTSYGAALRFQF